MHLVLIGMSNIGKSHWARRLAQEHGCRHIDCDRLIAQALLPEHSGADTRDLAAWLGQPGDAGYAVRSEGLLAAERQVMLDLLADLAAAPSEPGLVIDTSGSVIHVGDDVLATLRARARIVYLEATPAQLELLYARYLAEPKPLIWGDAWQPLPGEPVAEARRRCYPLLLAARAERYAALAHVIVPAASHDHPLALPLLLEKIRVAG